MHYSIEKHPNVHAGHQYALDVINKKIPACIYTIGAAKRYFKDLEKGFYIFDAEKAERYLKLTQLFDHVKGKDWKTKNITYEPWQCFVFMNIMGWIDPRTNARRFRVAHAEIPRGQGKALCLETEIPTPDRGLIKFKEISVGDKLYGSNGQMCSVIAKTPIHTPKAYRVTFSDGTTVDCSSEHLWVTSSKPERDKRDHHKRNPPKRLNKNGEIIGSKVYSSAKTTDHIFKTLKYGKESNHCIETCTPVIGSREDCQLGYVLGYWLGDGCSNNGSFVANKEQFDEISSRFASQKVDTQVNSVRGEAIHFICKGLTFWLKEMGVLGNKHVPEKYFMAPESVRREVLRGLMDSDGTITKTGDMSFSNTNERLIKDFRRLVASLGYRSSLSIKKTTAQNGFKGTSYEVKFSVPFTRPAIFGLRKKEQRRVDRPAYYSKNRYITNVEEIESKPMFCIEVDSIDHTFLITDQYIPTHNSLLASQAVLYFLALDDPRGNEISCAATKKEQARIVLDSARAMARSNKKYLEATGVEVLAHKIVHDKSNSFVRALSSDHDSLDGLNDVLCVMDELHAVSRELFDVIYSGMKKRRDSLMLCITTAGFNTDSVGHSQSVYAKKLLTGDIEDDTFFAIIYTIDEGDDLLDPKAWMKANPNFGVSVDPIVFEATAKKAMITPSDLPNFKVKNLNIWISEAQAFFDLAKWDKGADKSLKIEQFYGEKCYVGIDLASKIDLTCLAYVFKKDGIYYIFDRSYVPQRRVEEINNVLYDECVHRGQLIATKGEAIHYPHIQDEFKKDIKNFDIIAAHYDPWCATQFAQELCRERVDMVEFRMTTGNLSEPTKVLDALIREGKIRHNGSPIMRWCVGNVVCKEDANGNIFPRKSHEDLKIDIAVAIIMAIAGWVQNDNNNSVYEDQGIRILGL